jgi:hypothetical protein
MSMAGDILSHPNRQKKIHILTLDTVLADDVYDRIHHDPRMKRYHLISPFPDISDIHKAARDTVSSKVLILDVRSETLPLLQRAYTKVVGYNRRDLNRLCYIILIGDGPAFQAGKSLDYFVLYLVAYRVEYSPAAFFYDPILHYEPNERLYMGIDYKFTVSADIPKSLAPYFTGNPNPTMDEIRRFFRAPNESQQEVKAQRLQILINLYRKWLSKQFPGRKDQVKALFSKKGVRLASEKLHLYPLFFEDWVHDLMEKPIIEEQPPRV